jgi:hypothetical protein
MGILLVLLQVDMLINQIALIMLEGMAIKDKSKKELLTGLFFHAIN